MTAERNTYTTPAVNKLSAANPKKMNHREYTTYSMGGEYIDTIYKMVYSVI